MSTSGELRTGTGERLGPYRLLTRIGEGGMGVVRLALDPSGQAVAVKVLRPQVAADEVSRARLAREVETMRRVASPHVARVLDADVHGAQPYIVTSYVRGRPLDEVVRDGGPLTGEALIRLARGLADALAAIHAAGVVHRDLKPSNVLLVDGEPVVIDFGVAHAVDATRLTQTGLFIGTPGYLAPEVIDGAPVRPAADVHAWGATVAFAATGRPPFGNGPFEVVFYNITQGRADIAGVPEPLAGPVRAALARDPAKRPTAVRLRQWVDAPYDPPVAAESHGPAAAATRPYTARAPVPVPPMLPAPPLAAPPGATMQPPAAGIPRPAGYEAPQAHTGGAPQPRAAGAPWHAPPGVVPHAGQAREPRPVVGALLLAILACFVALAPVAGVVVVALLILALRTADGVATGLAARRYRRGPRPTDAVVGALGVPWHLAGALLVTGLTLPIAVFAGVLIGGVVMVLEQPYVVVADALAFGAAAFTLVSFFGPGGGRPRRGAARVLGALLPSQRAAVAAGLVLSVVLLVLLAAVGSRTTTWWPASGAPHPSLPGPPHLPHPLRLSELAVLIGWFIG